MIRRLVAVLAFGALLAGCSGLPSQLMLGPPPSCDITWQPPTPSSRGQLLLIAQSVPEATAIPCLGPLPPGWEFARAAVSSSGSRIVLTTDTYDLDVEIEFVETCGAVTSAPRIPTNEAGATLHASEDGTTFAYSFEGGCVLVSYPTVGLAASPEGRALFDEVHLMPRDQLRDLSGWEL